MDYKDQIEIKNRQVELLEQIAQIGEEFADLDSNLPERDRGGLIILGNVHRHEFEDLGVTGDHSKCKRLILEYGDDLNVGTLLVSYCGEKMEFFMRMRKAVSVFTKFLMAKFGDDSDKQS